MTDSIARIERDVTHHRMQQSPEMAACYLDAEPNPVVRFEHAVWLWDHCTDPDMREVAEDRVTKLLPDLLNVDPVRAASAARWLWETTRSDARSEEAVFWSACSLPPLARTAPQQAADTARFVWAGTARPALKALAVTTVVRVLEPLVEAAPCAAVSAARWLGQHTRDPAVRAYAARMETEALLPLVYQDPCYALRQVRDSWRTLTDPDARGVLPFVFELALRKADAPAIAASAFTGQDGVLDSVAAQWLRVRLSAPPGPRPRAALRAILEQENGALCLATLGQTPAERAQTVRRLQMEGLS